MLGSANLTGPGLGRSGRRNAECLAQLRLNEKDFNSVWGMFPDRFHKLLPLTKSGEGEEPFLSDHELLALLNVRWASYPRSVRLECPPAFRPHLAGFLVCASRSRLKRSRADFRARSARPHLSNSTIELEQGQADAGNTEEHGDPLLRDGCQIWIHAMRGSTVTSICRVVPLNSSQWAKAYKSIEATLGRESPASLLAAHLGFLEAPIRGGGGGKGDPGDPAGPRPGTGSTRAWRVERVIAGLVQGAEFSLKLKRELLQIVHRLPGKNERASLPTLLTELARLSSE